MGTVVKNTRGRKEDIPKRPLNQDWKNIPGQNNRIYEDQAGGRI